METRKPHDRGRGWKGASTSPGCLGATRSYGRQEGPSPGALGGSTALQHLDFGLAAETVNAGAKPSFADSSLSHSGPSAAESFRPLRIS